MFSDFTALFIHYILYKMPGANLFHVSPFPFHVAQAPGGQNLIHVSLFTFIDSPIYLF